MKLFTLEELNNSVNSRAELPLTLQEQLRIGNYRYITDSASNLEL